MPGRIVLYGATGYTGGLTARAMVVSGARPVLAGRDRGRLDAVAARLSQESEGPELETAIAGTERPGPLLDAGDVPVLAGTDVTGSIPGEVALLAQMGPDPKDALAAVSTWPRRFLGAPAAADTVTYHHDPPGPRPGGPSGRRRGRRNPAAIMCA